MTMPAIVKLLLLPPRSRADGRDARRPASRSPRWRSRALHPAGRDTHRTPIPAEAMRALDHALELGKRRFLIELPTGTGKTDLICLYLKRLFKAGRAERVLFLVDRDQLAKQALGAIQDVLSSYSQLLAQAGHAAPGAADHRRAASDHDRPLESTRAATSTSSSPTSATGPFTAPGRRRSLASTRFTLDSRPLLPATSSATPTTSTSASRASPISAIPSRSLSEELPRPLPVRDADHRDHGRGRGCGRGALRSGGVRATWTNETTNRS